MDMASLIGCKRRSESKSRARADKHGLKDGDFWEKDIEGAAAELAYCKFRNLFWSGSIGSFKSADCGQNVQIRWTKYLNGKLIVRSDDADDHYFVLVRGTAPAFEIAGWILGADAKAKQYEQAPNGREAAYFVPETALIKFGARAKPAQEDKTRAGEYVW
jgi:hypothetical protein